MSRLAIYIVGCLFLLTITIVESHVLKKNRRSYEPILNVELASEQCAANGYKTFCSPGSTNQNICAELFCAGEDLIAKSVGQSWDGINCNGSGTACYLGKCISTIRTPSNKPKSEIGEQCKMDGIIAS